MIDFHCHVDLWSNAHEIAKECQNRELRVLSVTTTPSAWDGTSNLEGDGKLITTALGLHPQLAHERKNELPLFDRILPSSPYVGEIGLDASSKFYDHWEDQINVFQHILDACTKVGGRIMSIHSRQASTDVLNLLEQYPDSGTPILHWFSGTLEELDRAIDLGCWFSVGPAMLKGKRGRDLVMRMPQERILTETDGPFVEMNGRSILPWEVNTAVDILAECWGCDPVAADRYLNNNLNMLLLHT